MSVYVLVNLLIQLGKKIKCKACQVFYRFFSTGFINLIILEQEC